MNKKESGGIKKKIAAEGKDFGEYYAKGFRAVFSNPRKLLKEYREIVKQLKALEGYNELSKRLNAVGFGLMIQAMALLVVIMFGLSYLVKAIA